MAEFDPWVPQPGPIQVGGPAPGNFMDDPRARAALLSFGLSMMQPPSFGDNAVSQIGRAIGAGGEAVGRVEAQARKDAEFGLKAQEVESRQDLRAAQADAATSRAETAAARASTVGDRNLYTAERLRLEQERLEQQKGYQGIQNQIRISNAYQKYVKDTTERNNDIGRPRNQPPEPILDYATWLQRSGLAAGAPAGASTSDGTSLPPTRTPGAATPAPSAASPSGNRNPPPPRNPAERKMGQVYSTFDGRNVQWDGKNFLEVP